MYNFCNTQHEVYQLEEDKNLPASMKRIEEKARTIFKHKKSVLLGVKDDGKFLFQASRIAQPERFADTNVLATMISNRGADIFQGGMSFHFNDEEYFGVFKYNSRWGVFIIRGEEIKEFYYDSWLIFRNVSIIILVIVLTSAIVGVIIIQSVTRFIHVITSKIIRMNEEQHLEVIDLSNAPNDDITFLGMSFNSLSSTINNLIKIFRKFLTQDIAQKAYQEKEVRLEGSQRDLTMLFTDIKSFTFITETLGTDIIKLLNVHYDRAIKEIMQRKGVIGSIIGDALLAVFGVLDTDNFLAGNKSYNALLSAYRTQFVAASLREQMNRKRREVIAQKGSLTEAEERVYKAVLIEVGVGIDGGIVFYGTIGSHERMTATVIGDTVNSASRLEGLTRVYKVPVIVSEYIRDDINRHVPDHGIRFVELDTVQVKGKTIGKKVYWPILPEDYTEEVRRDVEFFEQGLALYYEGNWTDAYHMFTKCTLSLSDVFVERTSERTCPSDWDGIWKMTTK